jgi:hypothetical protein
MAVCSVHSEGPFKLRGALSVGPQRECSMVVELLIIRPPVCGGSGKDVVCRASLDLDSFARGHPKGC